MTQLMPSDTLQEQKLGLIRHRSTSIRNLEDLWLRSVKKYSSLRISQESDRAYGNAGLAQNVQARLDDRYLDGIWAEDAPRGLL